MRASHLRALHALITPCPYTQPHVAVARERRAQDLLSRVTPRLHELPDGTLVPGQTAPEVAAALTGLSGDPWIEVLVCSQPPSSEPLPPLAADFKFRATARLMHAQTALLFRYWQHCGVMEILDKEVAHELMMSPSTYSDQIGWSYPYAYVRNRQ